MELEIISFSYAVEGLQEQGDWIFGTLSRSGAVYSPLAPRIDVTKAIRRSIRESKKLKERMLPAFVGPLVPLISRHGFIREIPSECLTEFLSASIDDVGSVKAFLRRYGLFDLEHLFVGSREQPKAIRGLWAAAEKADRIPFAFQISSFWDRRGELEDLQGLWAIVQKGSAGEKSVSQLCERIGSSHIVNFKPGDYETSEGAAHSAIRIAMTVQLANARTTLVEVNGELLPSLITSCVKDALFLHLWDNIARATPFLRCKRCGKAFISTKSTKRYCTSKCQAMAKRYRQLGKPDDFNALPT